MATLRWLGIVVAAAMLVAAGWWAGRVALGPQLVEPAAISSATVAVVDASVGRSLSLNATVVQPFAPVGVNGLAGTVTSVTEDGSAVGVGDTVYAVDTVPVRVVQGGIPFWRDLTQGAEGADVAQLQEALAELGHYSGEVDGRFRFATGQAVRAWQADLGTSVDGVVRLGELVALPDVPASVMLTEGIVPGARLGGGEPAVLAATGEVEFWLVVASGQEALIPPDAQVTVEYEGVRWLAVLGESGVDESGHSRFALAAPEGGPVCGDDCGKLPAQERLSLRAQVMIVPEVVGPAVPVAALRTDPGGQAWVWMQDGTRREVSVLGSSGGVAVVEGLQVGERVQVFGDPGENGQDAGG